MWVHLGDTSKEEGEREALFLCTFYRAGTLISICAAFYRALGVGRWASVASAVRPKALGPNRCAFYRSKVPRVLLGLFAWRFIGRWRWAAVAEVTKLNR